MIHRRRQWHPTPVLLPRKSHGRRSLVGCSPRGRWGSDTTDRLHFHFHALEKEMATHSSVIAWKSPGTGSLVGCRLWVAQSRTRLKRLSSSSSSIMIHPRDFEWTPGVGDGQGGLGCCDSWSHKELDTTERLNWTELNWLCYRIREGKKQCFIQRNKLLSYVE